MKAKPIELVKTMSLETLKENPNQLKKLNQEEKEATNRTKNT